MRTTVLLQEPGPLTKTLCKPKFVLEAWRRITANCLHARQIRSSTASRKSPERTKCRWFTKASTSSKRQTTPVIFFNGANVRTNSAGQHPFPGMAGRKLDSIKAQIRTILVTEWPAIFPYSWHQPKQPISDVGNCAFNDAMDMAGFVDGHVNYIKIHLRQPKADTISIQYDPPADYDYQWSGD